MPLIKSSKFAHVRLTVTNIERSKAFYDEVFGWPTAVDQSANVDKPGVKESAESFYGGVVYQMPSGSLLGLRPVAAEGETFNSEHTGLDHISFQVDSRDDLVAAAEQFAKQGIECGEVIDLTEAGMAILSFSDPDGVHCELMAEL